jgi:hypothetical protein
VAKNQANSELRRLRFQLHPRIPALLAGSHEDFQLEILRDADLARKTELTQDSIFFEALSLYFSHRRLVTLNGNPASGALCLSATTVAHIHSVLLKFKCQLGAFRSLKSLKSFRVNPKRRHPAKDT